MNKTRFFFLAVIHYSLFIIPFMTTAQKFNAGVLAGFVASQVDGDHLSGYDKPGVKAGGYVNRKISDKINLQFEMEFIQKGSRRPLDIINNIFYLLRLNYVEAPLMISYIITPKWSIEGGASVAVLISSHEEDETGIPYPTYTEPAFNSYD